MDTPPDHLAASSASDSPPVTPPAAPQPALNPTRAGRAAELRTTPEGAAGGAFVARSPHRPLFRAAHV